MLKEKIANCPCTKVSGILLLAWTALLGLLLMWNLQQLQKTKIQLAENDARISWKKDILFRLWSATHGGVYVPVSEHTPPNPYLVVPNRDVIIGGRNYTLVNPAYMTRQIYEMASQRLSIQGHITSLNPIRPENKADQWERKALLSFEKGGQEYKDVVQIGGESFVRLMRPFITQKACLRCHAQQGYKVGDVRGGISITVPLASYEEQYRQGVHNLEFAFFSIWAAGAIIITLMNWIIQDKINKLSQSEKHTTSILNNMDNAGFGLYIVDQNYRIRHTNSTMQRWFGIEPGKICYQVLYNRSSPCRHCSLKNVTGNNVTLQYSLQEQNKIFDIVDTPITLQDGTIALMEIRTDVTLQKETEIELIAAKEAAESATNAKSAFLANMSHDIRTPLNGIIGMLRLTLESSLAVDQRQNLSSAKVSADFLLGLLNDILDISKIDAGQLILDQQPFRLAKLFEDVTSIFTHSLREQGLDFHLELDDALPEVVIGDSLRVRQVIINLLGNAIKFTDQGSITLSARSNVNKDGSILLKITVADTGIGIPPAIQKTIFDSFSQADISTTRQYGGTGLGLAICKRLAEKMEGTVSVKSTVGQGSIFSFTARLRIGTIREWSRARKQNPSALPEAAPLTLLIVEDNELNRKVANMTLVKSGHTIFEAENGVEALEFLSHTTVDAILLDIQMPKMNGWTTAHHIRSCEQGKTTDGEKYAELLARLTSRIKGTRTPIIALTAHAMDEDRNQCLAAGMDDYLTKPFQPDQIENVLAAVIGQACQIAPSAEEPSVHLQNQVQQNSTNDTITKIKKHFQNLYNLDDNQIEQLLRVSVKSLKDNLEQARKAAAAQDGITLAAVCHALKGNLLNLGMKEQADQASKIEAGAKSESSYDYTTHIKKLELELQDLLS